MADITIYQDTPQTVARLRYFRSKRGGTIESIIAAWLDEKETSRSQSARTQTAYHDTLLAFRTFLQAHEYDLLVNGDEDFAVVIADAAQVFASARSTKSRRAGPVSPATVAQRLAILSSFYTYAIKRRHLLDSNPINGVKRPSVEPYAQAHAIPKKDVQQFLLAIDTSTLQGKRDKALLSVLLFSGRRVTEIAGLLAAHIGYTDDNQLTITTRTKGRKPRTDTLDVPVSALLTDWLETYYGCPLHTIEQDVPVWVSLSTLQPEQYGKPLGYHGISGVCDHYLHTTKVHTTRHTFGVLMEEAGAKLTDIQLQLGHKNPATTGIYLAKAKPNTNPFANTLSKLLGLQPDDAASLA